MKCYSKMIGALLTASWLWMKAVDGFNPSIPSLCASSRHLSSFVDVQRTTQKHLSSSETSTSAQSSLVLDGMSVMPQNELVEGLMLGGEEYVPATFAILNSQYEDTNEGWAKCEHVGVSFDLATTVAQLLDLQGPEKVSHVRAMAFPIPSEGAMESIADGWRIKAHNAGGKLNFDPVLASMELPEELEDDDDDDIEDGDDGDLSFMQMQADAANKNTVSPFDSTASPTMKEPVVQRPFTKEDVDEVLEEVRPYLIADGGNVAVHRVDEETRSVYLKLSGACGSCPSSTITLKEGIEKTLRQHFANLGQVVQVQGTGDEELSLELVLGELNKIMPAVSAMGGSVQITKVDPETGVVELKFEGPSKVRLGVQLAIQELKQVKQVEFVEG